MKSKESKESERRENEENMKIMEEEEGKLIGRGGRKRRGKGN